MKHYEAAFSVCLSSIHCMALWVKLISQEIGEVFFFARAMISLLWKLKRSLKGEIASYLLVLSKRFNYFQIARPKYYRQHFHPSTLFTYTSVHFQEEENIKLVKNSQNI